MTPLTHLGTVVHDAVVVVGDAEVVQRLLVVTLEVRLEAGLDVAEQDAHVLVAVGARLLVVEADRVAELVHDHRFLQQSTSWRVDV